MHKYTLHVELLLPIEQMGACILALLCFETAGFYFGLKVFNGKKVTGGAIKSSV